MEVEDTGKEGVEGGQEGVREKHVRSCNSVAVQSRQYGDGGWWKGEGKKEDRATY